MTTTLANEIAPEKQAPQDCPITKEAIDPLEDEAKHLASGFKLLADVTRLKILYFLKRDNELNVRSICDLLGQSQPAVSHHLAMLRGSGMITSRRQGKNNFYRVIPGSIQSLEERLNGLNEIDQPAPDTSTA